MSGSRAITFRTSTSAESPWTSVDLLAYLDAEGVERAASESNAWIKSLRDADIDGDGRTFRDRFTYRGDSLWWFAELFLHRQGVITDLWRVTLALEALIAREKPVALRYAARDPLLTVLAPQIAARHGIAHAADRASGSNGAGALLAARRWRFVETDLKSRAYMWSAFASRLIPRGTPPAHVAAGVAHGDAPTSSAADASQNASQGGTLAFVHSAFWKTSARDGAGEEGYIGAVLRELAARADAQPLRLVGVGPQTNFKARRWWHPITRRGRGGVASATDAARAAGPARASASANADSDTNARNRADVGESHRPHPAGAAGLNAAAGADARSAVAMSGTDTSDSPPARDGEPAARASASGNGEASASARNRAGASVRPHPASAGGLNAAAGVAAQTAWPIVPVERFASWRQLAGSRGIWRERKAIERALLASAALRERARVLGYDVWPIVREELRGVARLQFTWSARAMDEAGAAMDACRPARVLTYAEAGGWGRAIMLEARRRGIPSIGLQHGFIYRHWLNYLHGPDEMRPSPANPSDVGFPRPDLTLLYDGYAARHLRTAGHFPEHALRVTGSPGLDSLVSAVARVTDDDRVRIREVLGASPNEALAIVVSKYSQIRDALPSLVHAAAQLANPGPGPGGAVAAGGATSVSVRLVIKPHPAETAQPYVTGPHMSDPAGAACVTIAPPALDLAALLSVASLVITVNSTVALDAMTLGLPSLIVLLPNNLSPFVDAGVMAGAQDPQDLPGLLLALAQTDAPLRRELAARAGAFLQSNQIESKGEASTSAVDAMLKASR